MSITQLVAGANCAIPKELLKVEVQLTPYQLNGVEVDISAFLLASNGKVRGDEDMVFYGQPSPGNGSVALTSNTAGQASFNVNLPALNHLTEKIAFTATIHENRQSFGAFQSVKVTVKSATATLLEANISTNGMIESALILGEIYLRQGQWKFRSVAQGFAGGLQPLAEHFGVEVSSPTPSPAPAPAPAPAATAVAAAGSAVEAAGSAVEAAGTAATAAATATADAAHDAAKDAMKK